MQSPSLGQTVFKRIFLDWNKPVKRNIFLTTCSLQRIPHNVLFTTSFSQRLSRNVFFQRLSFNVFLTTFFFIKSFSQRLSHSVVFTPMPKHICPQRHDIRAIFLELCSMLRPPYKYHKISQIRLSSDTCNFDIVWPTKLKPRRCTSAIYILCVKIQNHRTEASYQSSADKVVSRYPKISQICLSSNPC